VAVLGAGAIGSLAGGLIARDATVTLVGRGAHIDAVSAHGLRMGGVLGEHLVSAISAAKALDFEPDVAFICCKIDDLPALLRENASRLGKAIVVLTQNGVTSHEIAGAAVPPDRLVSAVFLVNVRLSEPGHVTLVTRRPIVVGAPHPAARRHVPVVRQLLGAACDVHVTDEVVAAQWTKLIVNSVGNALDGMTAMSPARAVREGGLAPLAVAIAREALRVTQSARTKLAPLPGIPFAAFKILARAPMALAAPAFRVFIGQKRDLDVTTSTLQSLKRGKKTEIDHLNGQVVHLARSIGDDAPVNARVVELVHAIEAGAPFLSPSEARRRFAGLVETW
jgi:2-dehydropantoate 2-reductase